MIEETCGVMEKKLPSRHSPVQTKANFVSEKKSDFSPNKNARPRRGGLSNWGWKTHDPSAPRPASSQKHSRPYGDKRTRQRGGFGNRQSEEITDSICDDVDFEPKSRKHSGNHLLGFYFARANESPIHYGGHKAVGHRRGYSKQTKRYDKEKFLLASCQFVVRDNGDYKEQTISPDALVAWEMVELVRTFSTEEVNCAICRHSLYAGKITKCGHIYCWPCMLRYLSLGEKDFRKCPICYEAVKADDLKSVQVVQVKEYKVGDEIEMTLMQRSKGSNFVLPKCEWKERNGVHMNIDEGLCTKFVKLLLASIDQIRAEVIEREKIELDILMSEAEQDEVFFIEMAKEILNNRDSCLEKTFKTIHHHKEGPNIPGLHFEEKHDTLEHFHGEDDTRNNLCCSHSCETTYYDAFDDKIVETHSTSTLSPRLSQSSNSSLEDSHACLEIPPVVSEDPHQPDIASGNSDVGSPTSPFPVFQDDTVASEGLSIDEASEVLENPDPGHQAHGDASTAYLDTTFFYQESSGQHIYINSLNAKCLSLEYGGLQNSPDKISATIVAVERLSMTEEIRKRFRYLCHIPLTCEFHVVELKIKPPLVSKEILQRFKVKFEDRAAKRREKTREEKARAKRHEVEQRKTYGIYPEVHIPLDNVYQFPTPASHVMSPPEHDASSKNLDNTGEQHNNQTVVGSNMDTLAESDSSTHPTPRAKSCSESESQSPSFAQMLQTGRPITQSKAWPQVSSSSSSTQVLASPVSSLRSPNMTAYDDSDGEGIPVPSYATSVCAGLDELLIDEKLQRFSTGAEASMAAKGGGKKKKKKEKQLLFSTSMARKN